MSKGKAPVTQAVRVLREHKVEYTEHLYDYEDKGGTRVSSRALGVPEHCVIKTLVMQDEHKRPLIVLMHGDREVGVGLLARQIGVKRVEPCDPKTADRHSGYQVGGTSPFGTKAAMPVYMEASIAQLPRLYINGGKRGFLVGLAPADVVAILAPTPVNVAV
ncbi:Cys-tRNA(Pro) deacylase [Crenobacter luteus]|uniref:Cys-tRNA(Pro)/Cys-tRNA(Cys) deacylase n=1 Tax=Crenobacter luteus TaxID=1452487 RepID=A0A165FJX6_9NEIS|nr:Cys-tRNA(Pro) deacylase [Crenobacter luteus]KZE33502.1 aminoacyl-tRNA deacylase [Crenobacter luteus]TCP13066.1 Cys-tRNA(Pro) deacylase [Crenobacter luteus]